MIVAALLTLFLPYFVLEFGPEVDGRSFETVGPPRTIRYSGIDLITGSNTAEEDDFGRAAQASDLATAGTVNAFLVLVVSLLGLATTVWRQRRAAAFLLAGGVILLVLAGWSSTDSSFTFGGPTQHLGVGFALAVALLLATTVARIVLWRLDWW